MSRKQRGIYFTNCHSLISCVFLILGYLQALSSNENSRMDSLQKLLKNTPPDTTRLILLNQLSAELTNQGNYNIAIEYSKEGIASGLKLLFEKNKTNEIQIKKALATSYNILGNILNRKGNYPEALKNYFSSMKLREEINDQKGIAASYNNIGFVYSKQKDFEDALKNYSASVKIKKQLGDKKGLAGSYNNIGIIYLEQNNPDKAMESYRAALDIYFELNEKKGIAASFNNIGIVYKNLGKFEQALDYYLKALKINEGQQDKLAITESLINLGSFYYKTRNLKEARFYLLKGLRLSMEIGSLESIKLAYTGLYEVDSLNGDFRGALINYKYFIVYRDSLINIENTKLTVRNQMQFDFERKQALLKLEQEKSDAIAIEELEKQKLQRNVFVAGFFLVLVLGLISFRGYQNKQKANVLLFRQKQIIEEKNKEITDSIKYASRIQRALITSEKYIDKQLRRRG